MPRVSKIAAGESLAGYRLIELGGAGGMGRVYRAIQPGVDRAVALKVIRPDLAADPRFRERFEVESRLAASIDHPNVIPVYEADEVDGVLFVAMRWVEGRDLQRLLTETGPLDPARAVELLSQLADGLDAAHARGLIHRDIKPANVLLEGEHAFLSDFGLALTSFGGEESTQAGGLVGTVDYLAPELVDGGAATTASDVYALGCVLFQVLTGSVPFPVDGMIAKLHARTHDDPPAPSTVRPELPRGFDVVLARALARDPARRYGTAGELADAARQALRTAPRRPPRSAPSRRRRVLAGGAVVLAAAVAALVLVLTGALHGSAGAHHDSAGARSTGRVLPAPASLHPCGDLLAAPAGDCRGATGGVDVVAGLGTTAAMRTMDFEVTRVIQSRAILEPSSQDTVTAPPGYRFIVIECGITNRLPTPQVFEPDQFAHRQTALYLYTRAGRRLPPDGPRFANYSEQNLPATGLIPLSLLGKRFQPPRSGDVPFTGALVFSYPVADLRSARTMLLFVHEFGRGLGDESSVGVFRLPIRPGQIRPEYKAAII
jgi:protein kinase-like protein